MNDSDVHHVWKSTVALLGRISSPGESGAQEATSWRDHGPEASKKNSPVRTSGRPADSASFTIVDRVSDRSILICWCDATLGHYAEQLWIRGVARRSTLCVLSGLRVKRGDIVYRPSTRAQRPANCEEVILAVVVDGVTASIC